MVLKRLCAVLALCVAGAAAAGESCHTTPAYEGMDKREIALYLPGGERHRLVARVADDNVERASGFQHICVPDYARFPILFLLEKAEHTAFHMHNVHGALDIAFLDGEGRVLEVQRMDPYAPGAAPVYYRPSRPFSAALETEAGLLSRLKPERVELSTK